MIFFIASSQHISGDASDPLEAIWIDVRTQREYREGHVGNAILIPFDKIESGVKKMNLAKNTPIFLYCRSGKRSSKARIALEKSGYTNVVNVGGLEQATKMSPQSPHPANSFKLIPP